MTDSSDDVRRRSQTTEWSTEVRRLTAKMDTYCDVLRATGVSTIDSLEQITFLVFLKLADVQENAPAEFGCGRVLPEGTNWAALTSASGDALSQTYTRMLAELAKEGGICGLVFRDAQNKVMVPALLRKLILDLDQETWEVQHIDMFGEAYEQLLTRSATDTKSGAGQSPTSRALISAIVDCVQPTPDDTIVDPACGVGGFLLGANHYIHQNRKRFTPEQRHRLSGGQAFRGVELVADIARLAAMNLVLHRMCQLNGESPIDVRDALACQPDRRASLVLADPPFGRRIPITVLGENGRAIRESIAYDRDDFWEKTTSNQLSFVQHIARTLTSDGRAAVVVPDNVLFEGGAAEGVRRRLLKEYDVHTLLRLPTGILHASGVKANVLFFDAKRTKGPATKELWVYDFRTDQQFTPRQNPMRREHLQDFVECYMPGKDRSERRETDHFRKFTYDDMLARDKVNLDISWPTEEFKEFQRNLDFARRLVEGGRKLEELQVQAFDVGDMYRAAWVQAVAALDHWVYSEILTRAVALARHPGIERPKKFNQLPIPMELFERVHHRDEPLGGALRRHLEKTFAYVTFQTPEKIQEGFAHIYDGKLWPQVAKALNTLQPDDRQLTADLVRTKILSIARRRNQIAHEADRDPDSRSGKRAISRALVRQTIDWLEDVADAILDVLDGRVDAL